MKSKFIDPRMFKFIDWLLFANIIVLILFSFVAIASAQSEPLMNHSGSLSDAIAQLNLSHVLQQLTWFGIGLLAMFVVLLPDYHAIGEYYKWMYVIVVVLLVAVYFFGGDTRGIKGWFRIGNSGFQPAEIGKIVMVITMARMISDRTRGKDGGIKTLKDILPIIGVFAVPFMLVMIQPDWGTAFVYAFALIFMLIIARTSIKLIVGLGVCTGIVAVPVLWLNMAEWQKNRIFSFMGIVQEGVTEQEAADLSRQANQAEIAAGSGQLTGKGLFSLGGESRLTHIAEKHTDFIFASTAEAVGFIGALLIMLLYFALIFRTMYVASKAKDDFGMLLVVGVMAMMLYHVFQNIGMNIGVMPISGIPLPFFSYGGSNLLTNMIAYGIVINVGMRRQIWGTSKIVGGATRGLSQRHY